MCFPKPHDRAPALSLVREISVPHGSYSNARLKTGSAQARFMLAESVLSAWGRTERAAKRIEHALPLREVRVTGRRRNLSCTRPPMTMTFLMPLPGRPYNARQIRVSRLESEYCFRFRWIGNKNRRISRATIPDGEWRTVPCLS